MKSLKSQHTITGWIVFAIAFVVFFMSAERTGSLWDCGEFITGAYKLQVVHPPGAPLFVLVGRVFTLVAEVFSDNPEDIAFSVNLMSGICTAFAAAFVAWITIMLGKLAFTQREGELDSGQTLALSGAGLVAGLSTAFTSSVWFSAVEGEVYAMSTFFTALTLWSVVKWYSLPDGPRTDRWLIFAVYAAGLSIGVHLLSLLTFPALALFYYFKRYKETSFLGMLAAAGIGVLFIVFIQTFIIVGIPKLWSAMELMTVNSMGLPVHSGLIPTFLIVAGVIAGSLYFAHKQSNARLQKLLVAMTMAIIGYSTIGVVVIRANANTPINMNAPSDAMRLIPYINREQYGERALLNGPDFDAQAYDSETTDRYGLVGDRYEVVDQKVQLKYRASDKHFFPRMQDNTQSRPQLYQAWMRNAWGTTRTSPTLFDNIMFTVKYQIGWMYWRYFFWNFSGRQNAEQGYYNWDITQGNWSSGIGFVDEARLHEMSELPTSMRENEGRNRYYMLPFLFGLLGLIFHFRKRNNDALALLALFIITGIGIIIYSNQPPNEPRERDYVLAGSFFTYCIWIGLAVPALYEIFRERASLSSPVSAMLGAGLVAVAPLLMLTQNFDDHGRKEHTGARDYASNFLNSVDENAIIFTYGDNDTYPLWYAQEVEGIRTDVRVVNLSLIAVDWYIDQLRRKVNESPAIDMTIPREAYRGSKRVITYYRPMASGNDAPMNLKSFVNFIGEDHPFSAQGRKFDSFFSTKNVFIPVNKQEAINSGIVTQADTANIVDRVPFAINKSNLIKDELAILDIIATNAYKRPIYFAVTCQPGKMMGLQDYMQLEGLALKLVPIKSTSDPLYSVIGSGRVASDKVYENIMKSGKDDERYFRWGNFDNEDLFVDRSYMPSVQSHRLVMLRTAGDFINKGDNAKAVDMVDQYFEAFPHMNFPYDINSVYFIEKYVQADANDKAKIHLEILANEMSEKLTFFESLDANDLQGAGSFEQDYNMTLSAVNGIMTLSQQIGDEALLQKYEGLFGGYVNATQPLPN
ncbi:MAG: DUF2723 domain-containing protein [Bacteroidota bacterium]